MPIQDKIVRYSVYVAHNDFVAFQRVIDLRLESGGTATIAFPKDPPNDWLQFGGSHTTLFMLQDEFADVSGLLQAESPVFPVFFTALNLLGIRVGAVHTELDLRQGESPGRVDGEVASTLQELIRRAKREHAGARPPETRHTDEHA